MGAAEDSNTRAALTAALGAAVPLWVREFRTRPWSEISAIAKECGDIVASKGDNILFRSKKKGETAEAFNALAKALAVLSFSPGGVTFLGEHWEYKWNE
jgi:hypothetical protein